MLHDWSFVANTSNDLLSVLMNVEDDGLDHAAWVQAQIARRGKTRSEVVRDSFLNPTFGYQLISGRRNGTRDKLIQLSFGIGLDIDQTGELLERNGLCALRLYDRRDVVIAFCLARHMGVPRCDETLLRAGMAPLRKGYPDLE